MLRSLRGRLIVLLLLLATAATAAGILMVDLFRMSAAARAGRAEAELGRACDAIAAEYHFYSSGWQGPSARPSDEVLRRDLTTVVYTALRNRPDVEGGIWQAEAGSLAYAFPTYQGSGPKTDVPQAELPRIRATNLDALTEERQISSRYDAASQILLVAACPLSGPVTGLTGWVMTRVATLAGQGYPQLMAGLGILFASVLAAASLLTRLTVKWSRHISQIESALQAHDVAELPILSVTGERELDRIVTALNEAGHRLAQARQRANQLARQVAIGERLAAIGRVAAGVAHEIRNPIAAMRLRAENAIAGDAERRSQALFMILEQVERIDALLRRLLTVTEPDRPRFELVAVNEFLNDCIRVHAELARAKGMRLEYRSDQGKAHFDPEQMRGALDNLIRNALEAAPAGSRVVIAARRECETMVLSVHDDGAGPPAHIRDHLFEPFVTSRADGTGLGLSIVREVAVAHGGTVRLADASPGTTFEILVPWQQS